MVRFWSSIVQIIALTGRGITEPGVSVWGAQRPKTNPVRASVKFVSCGVSQSTVALSPGHTMRPKNRLWRA